MNTCEFSDSFWPRWCRRRFAWLSRVHGQEDLSDYATGGQTAGGQRGPFRLIVPGDKRGGRAMHQVNWVHN